MYKLFGKRLFDIVLSLVGILVCAPLLIITAILVKLDSKGSVFFIQKRMGRKGRLFSLIKFRTMFSDSTGENQMFEAGNKSRITRIGKFLRLTKIDEFPQLINILIGDMSFVGPRPEVTKYQDFYTGDYSLVLSIRPGITDIASIKYRHEENLLAENKEPEKFYREVILPDKLKINKEYVDKQIGFINDLNIVIKTILSVLIRK